MPVVWLTALCVLRSAHGYRHHERQNQFAGFKELAKTCACLQHGSASRVHPVQQHVSRYPR